MNIYRVLLEDSVNGKSFRFAIKVKGENKVSSENMDKYGMTEDECKRFNATNKALAEFPEANVVEVIEEIHEEFFAP